MEIAFLVIILILSVVIHEVSHGYAALALGDPTARLAGRLTLNPLKHLDPLGSIILPALLVFSGASFLIGWAKPVPYNPYNLRHGKWGEAFVAAAGPLTNLFLALVFGLLIRFGASSFSDAFLQLASFITYINILLALFNLVPIPPLDGSKILAALLPHHLSQRYLSIQNLFSGFGFLWFFLLIFVLLYFLWPFLAGAILWLFEAITGMAVPVL
jgi:Zn-dependent protease